MTINSNRKKKFPKIPPDKETGYRLEFENKKIITVMEHDFLLSDKLKELPWDTSPQNPQASVNPFMVKGYNSRAFELIHDIINMIKKKDHRLYLKYLNKEKPRGNMKSEYSTIFKERESSNIIEAANLSSFLSMDLPKRVLVWFIADYIRNNTNSITDITKFLGATPLDEDTCLAHGLDESDNFWEVYPEEFQNIFGKPYFKPSSSKIE
ncbi:hypothetical protein FO519_004817 [Halicephalobus sp. NKZ332]|nr:hypothetical protein FO519_004817 [Halicephalobus sp. NKZ332]